MRDEFNSPSATWTDYLGRVWPVIQSRWPLKFKYPSHAALRAHVFHRDGYKCVHCGAKALNVPADYDGAKTLFTDKPVTNIFSDYLVIDHIQPLKTGGLSTVVNVQTLCETCQRKKLCIDRAGLGGAS